MAYHVYMLASQNRALYIGVTNDLGRRIEEHQGGKGSKFTAKYKVQRLVYFEDYTYVEDAIAREKQLKGWRRSKKVALIEEFNPNWTDLAANWFQ